MLIWVNQMKNGNNACPNLLISAIGVPPLGVDLLRFSAAPSSRLSHFPFESDGAFPAQC
jgi:hypothetical protein